MLGSLLSATLFLILASTPSFASSTKDYVRGRLLVKVDPDEHFSALGTEVEGLQVTGVQSFSLVKGLYLYKFNENIDIETARQVFLANPAVKYAEPDYIYTTEALNDPEYTKQWALQNNGQTGGLVDADINAEKMWAIEQGSPDIVVGIIDTGVDYNHPDLINNLWRNPGEIPSNNKDDDANGYKDDINGVNTIVDDGNPFDDNLHGTHVAGTIGAQGNNNRGVVGVAQTVKIAACKFLSSSGSGANSDAIQCLEYFANLKSRANNRVNIVATNNSWGGGSSSQAMIDAIKAHEALGILFIAAAGNETNNNDIHDRFPSNYAISNVISVAATDHNDRLASFSNFGKKTVHVAAPGVDILSTLPGNKYGKLSGTSMATPHVTGLAAVIASHFRNLDYIGIKNLILSGGQKVPATLSTTISGRRIRGADDNGIGSLSCVDQLLSIRQQPLNNDFTIPVGGVLLLSALRINCAVPAGPLTVFDNGSVKLVLEDNGTNGDQKAGDGIYSLLWRPNVVGNYELNFGDNDKIRVSVYQHASSGKYKADDTVAYAYETIEGQRLNTQDEAMHWIKSPFPIKFGASLEGFEDLFISSNGTISFTDRTSPGHENLHLPTSAAHSLIAPYWDDLTTNKGASDIYVDVVGESPNRKLIVEWWKMRHYRSTGEGTFQVVFNENSSDIRFNYLDTNLANISYNSGISATVGIQSSLDAALEYSYKKASIPSFSSILFKVE